MSKKKTITLISIFILLMMTIFKITIAFEYEYEIKPQNAIIENKVAISHYKIWGGLRRNYILFTTLHSGFFQGLGHLDSGIWPEQLRITIQGIDKPIYNMDVDFTSIYFSFENDFQKRKINKIIKSDSNYWKVSRRGRDNIDIEKVEPGKIRDIKTPNNDIVFMELGENERAAINFHIWLDENNNRLLKEGSKCKLGLTITDEHNVKTYHEVVYTVINMKRRIRPYFSISLMWAGI